MAREWLPARPCEREHGERRARSSSDLHDGGSSLRQLDEIDAVDADDRVPAERSHGDATGPSVSVLIAAPSSHRSARGHGQQRLAHEILNLSRIALEHQLVVEALGDGASVRWARRLTNV